MSRAARVITPRRSADVREVLNTPPAQAGSGSPAAETYYVDLLDGTHAGPFQSLEEADVAAHKIGSDAVRIRMDGTSPTQSVIHNR